MQTKVAQVIKPLARSRRLRQDAFDQPSGIERLYVAVDRGSACPAGHTHHQVVGPLQGIAQQPVQEPPIDLRKRRTRLRQHLRRERVSRPALLACGLRHRQRPFPRLLRAWERLHPLRDTSDAGAMEPLPPPACSRLPLPRFLWRRALPRLLSGMVSAYRQFLLRSPARRLWLDRRGTSLARLALPDQVVHHPGRTGVPLATAQAYQLR